MTLGFTLTHLPYKKNVFADLYWSQEWSWEMEKNVKSDNYLKIFIPDLIISRMCANFAHACARTCTWNSCQTLFTRDNDYTPNTQSQTAGSHVFFTWWPWPMTMTIELGRDIIKAHLHTKIRLRTSNGSAVTALNYRQTHAHTGLILLPRTLTWEVKIPYWDKSWYPIEIF